jgi:D-alanine-D-alanine ligase
VRGEAVNVVVLYTLPPLECEGGRSTEEFDLTEGAEYVALALEQAHLAPVQGHAAEIANVIELRQPDVIFNMCEAPLGRPDLEAHAAALLEWMGVSFTGCGSDTLGLCRRKRRMNALLAARGVAVPREGVFPALVKPAEDDGSAGIQADSICVDAAAVDRVRTRIAGPVLIEEFIDGREFVVSLWGNRAPEHVSVGEYEFLNGLRVNTYASKWDVESRDFADTQLHYRTDLEPGLRDRIVAAARAAWYACGARGYIRVDVRCDAHQNPFVLDVNPNPAIGPGVGICRAVEEAGWAWTDFVHRQLEWARDR